MGDQENNLELPKEISFHYIKSNLFRVMFTDGSISGLTSSGMIHIEFYNERTPIPTKTIHLVKADGTLGDEIKEKKETKTGIVREVECEILIPVHAAKDLIKVLTSHIKIFEEAYERAIGKKDGIPSK